MFRRFLGASRESDIEHVVVALIHRAQLQIRKDSGDLKRNIGISSEESQRKFERIYWLSDLCHSIIGPFSFPSKKLRRKRLLQCLSWAWGVSHTERRSWMVENFKELKFDYSVLNENGI